MTQSYYYPTFQWIGYEKRRFGDMVAEHMRLWIARWNVI